MLNYQRVLGKFQIFWLILFMSIHQQLRHMPGFVSCSPVLKLRANSRGWTIIIQRMCVLRKHQTNIREALFLPTWTTEIHRNPSSSGLALALYKMRHYLGHCTDFVAQLVLVKAWARGHGATRNSSWIPELPSESTCQNIIYIYIYLFIALYCCMCIYIYIHINHHHMLYGLYTSHTCVYNSCRNNSCLKSSCS